MNNISRTNWERLDALGDDEIDTSDSPPLSGEFFAKAQWLLPGDDIPRHRTDAATVRVKLELDSKVLLGFSL